jgi:hypothetical protein
MSNAFIDSFAERLYDSGIATEDDPLVGCSPEEISEIENTLGLRLPAIYQAYLLKMGRRSGDFLRGEEHSYPHILTLIRDGQSLLRECDVDYKFQPTAFVFWMSQGTQFALFDTAEGDDPPVYHYREDDPEPIKRHDRYSQWLDYQLAGALELQERLKK